MLSRSSRSAALARLIRLRASWIPSSGGGQISTRFSNAFFDAEQIAPCTAFAPDLLRRRVAAMRLLGLDRVPAVGWAVHSAAVLRRRVPPRRPARAAL